MKAEKNTHQSIDPQRAVLDLQGATCTSCKFAIEHYGKRLEGLSDIHVDAPANKIYVEYDGDETILDSIIWVVRKIGYDASVSVRTGQAD